MWFEHIEGRRGHSGLRAAMNPVKIVPLLLVSFLSGCATQDRFPMKDEKTGRQVVCKSGKYWMEEGMPQMRIALECIHACERYGFRLFTGNPNTDRPDPRAPEEDVTPQIPMECLP